MQENDTKSREREKYKTKKIKRVESKKKQKKGEKTNNNNNNNQQQQRRAVSM